MKNNPILITSVIFFISLVLSIGPVSAEIIYSEQIDKGDGYQINNYVMHLTSTMIMGDIYPEIDFFGLQSDGTNIDLNEYVKTSKKLDGTMSIVFEKGTEKIEIEVQNATSSYVIIDIQTTGITVEYKNPIDGGISNAKYIGEPNLILTKSVDKTSVAVGEVIRVTIKAKNTGNGVAKRISIDEGLTPDFILKSRIYTSYPTELDVSNKETEMFIYEIQATKAGTFQLGPAIATYYSSVFDDEYASTSDSTTITVSEEPVETSEIKLIVSTDKTKLKRGNTVTFKVNVENLKEVPASNIRIEPIIPKNLTYVSGSEEIYIINEKPIIQVSSYGGYHKAEYMLTFKADQVGYDKLIVKWTYNNGVEEISNETSSEMVFISQGDFDFLAEFPIYVYLTPIIIILALAGWFYWRSNQFKM
ncbi:MAG TPA: BatD family protein [archaeon]|nr:BatD family protein [archaeon]